MARPKLKPADRRATSLPAARCLPEEKQRIEQAAGAVNLSVSEFIVRSCLGVKIRVTKAASMPFELIFHLKAIGNNLNQIARQMNATGNPPPPELLDILRTLRAILSKPLKR